MRRATRAVLGAAVVGPALFTGWSASAATAAGAAPAVRAAPAVQVAPAATAVTAAYGFALADQPTNTSPYAPNGRMSANSTGAANQVTRFATGNYDVRMPGLGGADHGNVQVTAYGDGTNRCKTSSWVSTASDDLVIGVRCFTAAGAPADTPFTVQFHRGSNNTAHQSAYLLSSAAGVVPSAYSFNSTGGSNTVTKNGTGSWTVGFGPGFTRLGGVVHVTARGAGSEHCKVSGWGVSSAVVRCFGASGAPADSAWSLRYLDQHLPNGFAELGGYLWANDSGAALGVPYAPDPRHSFNMLLQGNTVERVATGRYEAFFPRIPAFDRGNPMVTAHGTDNASCKVTQLLSSGSSSRARVACNNPAGEAVNARFTITQVSDR